MTVRIKLTIDVETDFHIGTGSGRGRATDAVFLRDSNGVTFVPGSTIKGLASDWAEKIVRLHRSTFGYPPTCHDDSSPSKIVGDFSDSCFRELFGGGKSSGFAEDCVFFDNAYPRHDAIDSTVVRTGRSARDRHSGRSKDEHLFFFEDAPATQFETELICEAKLSKRSLLLLLLSLRSINAIGGQRRRGKGKCKCTVEVVEASEPELVNLKLPCGDNEDQIVEFKAFVNSILKTDPKNDLDRDSLGASETISMLRLTEPSNDDSPEADEDTVWFVFGYAKSPISISYHRAVDNVAETFDFIPGTTIRGAIAWNWLRNGVLENDPVFDESIAKEKIRFGPLYPAAITNWVGCAASMPMPFPASIHTCKHYPGTKPSSRQHGFGDRLSVPLSTTCSYQQPDEHECDGALKPLGGYLQLTGRAASKDISFEHGTVQLEVAQRTAINRQSQRAEEGQLYGFESIARGTYFGGYVRGPKHLLESVLIPWKEKWASLRVGKVRTRGMGHLLMFCRPINEKQHKDYPGLLSGSEDKSADDTVFSVTLYSDLIALDPWMRPLTKLSARQLWRMIGGEKTAPFTIKRGYVSTLRIGGYIGKVGIPRTPDTAIRAGSTWKFAWNDTATVGSPERIEAWEKLMRAQQIGIGLRRADGFGQIILNHPIHGISECFGGIVDDIVFDTVAIKKSPRDSFNTKAHIEPRVKVATTKNRKPNSKYKRLCYEIATSPEPASELLVLLKTLSTSRRNKADSLKEFVGKYKEKLFGTTGKSSEELLEKLAKIEREPGNRENEPKMLGNFRCALFEIAKGQA